MSSTVGIVPLPPPVNSRIQPAETAGSAGIRDVTPYVSSLGIAGARGRGKKGGGEGGRWWRRRRTEGLSGGREAGVHRRTLRCTPVSAVCVNNFPRLPFVPPLHFRARLCLLGGKCTPGTFRAPRTSILFPSFPSVRTCRVSAFPSVSRRNKKKNARRALLKYEISFAQEISIQPKLLS